VTHLLDTNACVDFLRRGTASKVDRHLAAAPAGSVVLSSVVVAELLYGAWRSTNPPAVRAQVLAFSSRFVSLPFDNRAAEEYGRVRAHLAGIGLMIGPNDLLIAATALANGLTLVTHNTTEFGRVPGLPIKDWQV
jgi:tRNA(fMet)-specific endonuclease VapC